MHLEAYMVCDKNIMLLYHAAAGHLFIADLYIAKPCNRQRFIGTCCTGKQFIKPWHYRLSKNGIAIDKNKREIMRDREILTTSTPSQKPVQIHVS